LRSLNPEAAKTFVYLYLGDLVEDAANNLDSCP
jgi:hypothetical protein